MLLTQIAMKQRPDIWLWLKWVIVAVAWAYVFVSLANAPDLSQVFYILKNSGVAEFVLFLLVVLLIPVNWGIEALKWKILIQPLHPLPFINCFRAVLQGVTAGMLTPNRLGEFAGRIVDLPAEKRSAASVLSITGSFSQLFVTMLLGVLAFAYMLIYVPHSHGVFAVADYAILLIALVAMGVLLWFFTHTKLLANWIHKIPIIKKHQGYAGGIENIRGRKGLTIMLLSMVRYAVFLHQFYLLLVVFRVDIAYNEAIMAIAGIYLLIAIIPMLAVGEPGVRGSVSILLFALFTSQPAAVFSVSLLLWILNVAFPAIIGSVTMLRKNKPDIPDIIIPENR